MKFEVELTRNESRAVQVDAEDRDEAYRAALKMAPGFRVDCVSVVTADDASEPGPAYGLDAVCNTCGKPIWDGQDHYADDDGDLCLACAPTPADATA